MRLLKTGRWITALGFALLAAVYVRAVAFTPVERMQGVAQKIFYLHVPAALWTETGMVLVGVASIFFLFLKDPRLDRFAEACAEVGLVFGTIVLVMLPRIHGWPSRSGGSRSGGRGGRGTRASRSRCSSSLCTSATYCSAGP